MTNTYLLGLIAMLVRVLVIAAAGAVGVSPQLQAWIDANMTQWTQITLSVAGALVTVGYAIWKQFFDKQKLVQALSEASLTERDVERMVQSAKTPTPSVLTAKTDIPTT